MQYKLKALFLEKGIQQKEIAGVLGITERTLSRKMRMRDDFTLSEVFAICAILDIQNPFDVFLKCPNRKAECCNILLH